MFNDERIVSVRAYLLDPHDLRPELDTEGMTEEVMDWRRQKVANPMTKYPEFRDNRTAGTGNGASAAVIVIAESASGHIGVGSTNGGVAAAAIVELHLAGIVEGESVFAHERVWDRMFHSTIAYGRKGLVLHAISAVDLALWDLHGKITQ